MITAEQRELRRKHLGSSDAAPALGLSPWKSPRELWLEKTGQLKDVDLSNRLSVEMGNRFERPILDAALERMGLTAMFDEMRVHSGGILAANFDALAFDAGDDDAPLMPVEAKFADSPERWGPESAGLDGIPQEYAAQVVEQIAVAGAMRGFLAVYFAGRGRELRIYEIAPPAALVAGLEKTLTDWWHRHVVGMVPPEQEEPCDLETLARVIRAPGSSVEIDPGLLATWRAAAEVAKNASAEADAAKARVIEALGQAETGSVNGTEMVTYREQTRKGYIVADSTFRVLRATKACKGGGL